MKPSPNLLAAVLVAGCPLLFAAGTGLMKIGEPRRGLDRWTYLLADNDRVPTSKKKGSFGIAFGDVNGDRFVDIASGAHFYRNPGGDMSRMPWARVDLPPDPASGNPLDAGLLFNVKGKGAPRDILAEALPNVVWLYTDDSAGATWRAKVVAQMPPPRHGNGRLIRIAKITPGFTRPERTGSVSSSTRTSKAANRGRSTFFPKARKATRAPMPWISTATAISTS